MKTMNIEEVDARDKIMEYLKEEERPLAWLSNKSGIKYNTLYSIMVQRVMRLSKERRRLINEALNTEF